MAFYKNTLFSKSYSIKFLLCTLCKFSVPILQQYACNKCNNTTQLHLIHSKILRTSIFPELIHTPLIHRVLYYEQTSFTHHTH